MYICAYEEKDPTKLRTKKLCFKLTSMARLSLFLSFLFITALISSVNGRVLNSLSADKSILLSDGSQEGSSYEILTLDPPNRLSKNACVHVYGFLPCADNVAGYVFQVFSFGCLLIIGENFLSEGRTKLFVIFEVGFYGGIVFPLLTMFTRIALILCKKKSFSSLAFIIIIFDYDVRLSLCFGV